MGERRDHCIRCGQCCLKASPTLQEEDVDLVRDGFIQPRHLYTIRAGEPVWDNVHEELITTKEELIKLREKKGKGGCIYYDEGARACRIYNHRPAQCAALACWDPHDFMEVYGRSKASRRDIIRDGTLVALIHEHEKRCSYSGLERLLERIQQEGEDAVREILKMLRFDYHLRPLVSEKTGVDSADMDFLFGRPLIETIPRYGLRVSREPDGSFFLTTLSSPP